MSVANKKYGFVFIVLSIGLIVAVALNTERSKDTHMKGIAKNETTSMGLKTKVSVIELNSADKLNIEDRITRENRITMDSKVEKNGVEFSELETTIFLRKDNTLNAEPVLANLIKENFNNVLTELSNDFSERSILKKQELSEILSDVQILDSLDYKYECGNGVCAIMIPYVEKEMLGIVTKAILPNLKMGAIFSKNIIKDDGYIEFRTIFGDDSKYGDTLTLNPALLSEQ